MEGRQLVRRIAVERPSTLGSMVPTSGRPGPRRRQLAGVSGLVLILTLLSAGIGLEPPATLAATSVVSIGGTLTPTSVTIRPGDSVTWRNDDPGRHRMRTTSGPVEFDSGNLEPGETFSVTFATIGTYRYRDERDPDNSSYWGTIVVSTATPPPGSSPTPPPGATAPPAVTPPPGNASVTMAGRVFRPAAISIVAGGRVSWLNDDDRDHTVSARDGSYDSGIMRAGASYARTFAVPGTYAYLCLIHPDMTGTVSVAPSPGTTAPPPTSPPAAPTPTPHASGPADVRALDFAFSPASIDVVVGTTVSWVNRGSALHTVTAADGSFDSGLIPVGSGFTRRFAVPGTFNYLCALHPGMTGVVRVSSGSGATAPPPAPTSLPPAPASAPPGAARILDFAFTPSFIRVAPGSRVTWVNEGVAPHTVTSPDGAFDSGIISAGGSYARTFDTPGTFPYLCSLHPDMTGTLIVAVADAGMPVLGAGAPPGAGGPSDGSGGLDTGPSGSVAQPGRDAGAGGAGATTDPAGTAASRGVDPVRLVGVLVLIALALAAGGRLVHDTARRAERSGPDPAG